ncbi:tetratricopeptide repeat protein [Nonomuraea gerenzanensis]|nr:tetratricopeptide repeat protein [Nonomuraea gerenzanensis]UBU18088.1 tetratricopeptide repeat protein [Nonomuraea gerenzanensis]
MASEDQQPIVQNVSAVDGFAYGVIGADIHVFGNGMPLYLLERWRSAPEVDPQWLRELPSRMLNARFAVVDFTGRADELADLRQWRGSRPRLAARWLHAPGGQGKTRLAAQLADESLDAGWRVVTAIQGPGSVLPPPGSQDLRLDGAAGLLLIVDYADQWPLTHLTWLFSNALLHRSAVPVRVLMLARSADVWPAVRASLANLANLRVETSTQPLKELPDDPGPRREMFRVARDSFAARYGLADAVAINPPGPLGDPDFGLTLALHMAALVAVDAHICGGKPPGDMAGLTIYLLDREHLHWTRLHQDAAHDLNPADRKYRTPPAVMNRTVFTAALTGALPETAGATLVQTLRLPLPAEQVIADHSLCYPPADPFRATVLEPLYPDRLAEDFLALTFPGHTADYPAQPWAAHTAGTLLTRDSDHAPPAWTPRAITFLATATQRWPHLGPRHLYPLLRHDPKLALTAGSAALTALASLDDVEPDLLEAIESHFPNHRHIDLDIGIAAVAVRLTGYRLAAPIDLVACARIHDHLAARLSNAGWYARALAATDMATKIWHHLARLNRDVYLPDLAASLNNHAARLTENGRPEEALPISEEAVTLWRELVGRDRGAYLADLAAALDNRAIWLAESGRPEEALPISAEAVSLYRDLAGRDRGAYLADLAAALDNRAIWLAESGRPEEALPISAEAVTLRRELADQHRNVFLPDLAKSLNNHAVRLAENGRPQETLPISQEAVTLRRELVDRNRDAFLPELTTSLNNHANWLAKNGRPEEALPVSEEAVALRQELVAHNRDVYLPDLAMSLNNHAALLAEIGRSEEALPVSAEAIALRRKLANRNRDVYLPGLATSLYDHAVLLAASGRREEALPFSAEAVTLRRELVGCDRDAYLADLAAALTNFAAWLAESEWREEALPFSAEAVTSYRELVPRGQDAYLPLLATSLSNLAALLAEIGQPKEAWAFAAEALMSCRELAKANPAVYLIPHARSTMTIGYVLIKDDRFREAIAPLIDAFHLGQQLPESAQGIISTIFNLLRRAYAADPDEVAEEFRLFTDLDVPEWMKKPLDSTKG